MRYSGNVAYQLDTHPAWEVAGGRTLSVHEGGRLGSRSRREAQAASSPVVRAFAVLMLASALVCIARVALVAATVSSLKAVSAAESTVAQEQVTRTKLQVERSALSSADRIQRIATENYGMVYASDIDTVFLSTASSSSTDADVAAAGDESADGEQFYGEADEASPLS